MSAALTPPWLCLTTEVAALPWLCNVGSNSEHCIQLNEGWLSLPWRQAQALPPSALEVLTGRWTR